MEVLKTIVTFQRAFCLQFPVFSIVNGVFIYLLDQFSELSRTN